MCFFRRFANFYQFWWKCFAKTLIPISSYNYKRILLNLCINIVLTADVFYKSVPLFLAFQGSIWFEVFENKLKASRQLRQKTKADRGIGVKNFPP